MEEIFSKLNVVVTNPSKCFSFFFRWKESTLSNPYHIARATWPVPYIEAVFLPEFKIKGPITESSFEVAKIFSLLKEDVYPQFLSVF